MILVPSILIHSSRNTVGDIGVVEGTFVDGRDHTSGQNGKIVYAFCASPISGDKMTVQCGTPQPPKEGRWEPYIKYIEQNCSYFLCMKYTEKYLLATMALNDC